MEKGTKQCEGMRRIGGMMTFGPVTWKRCENVATVILKIKQRGEKPTDMPACDKCWEEARDPQWGIKILSARPIIIQAEREIQKEKG